MWFLQEGVDLNTKVMDLQCYHPILHYVGKHYYVNNFWRKKRVESTTGTLASSVISQCLYHDVFTMYLRSFLPNDLYFLKYSIQQIITNSTSPPNRCTMTSVAEVNWVVDSWTTTPKATTVGSSLGFEDNVCEDTLSSQSIYQLNSGCLSYKASIPPNPKLLNYFEPSTEHLETVYKGNTEKVNGLQLQIASKKPFLPLIIKAKPSILILLKFKPKMLFFGFLMT